MQFELTLENQEVPEFDKFLEFIEKRSHLLESIARNIPVKTNNAVNKSQTQSLKSKGFLIQSQNKNISCPVCKESHSIYKCFKFKKMTIDDRIEIVKKHNLCFNCLHHSHVQKYCRSKVRCSICSYSHNSLLHRNSERITQPPSQTISKEEKIQGQSTDITPVISNSSFCVNANSKLVLINTAIVYLRNSEGEKFPFKAILDSASTQSFCSFQAANMLRLNKQKINVSIGGLNESTFTAKSQITSQLSNANDEFNCDIDLLVVPKITDVSFSNYINVSNLKIPKHIKLADPEFNQPTKIDLLLGAEFFFEFLKPNKVNLENSKLILQDSCFGYLVSGSLEVSRLQKGVSSRNDCFLSMVSLDESIKAFWEVESVVEETNPLQNNELTFCNDHFMKTHYRNSEGRYVVEMPLKPHITADKVPLGDSRALAELRLEQLWHRLDRNPEMKNLYVQFMQEYEDLGHMTNTTNKVVTQPGYFLPHHCVYKPLSISTKLRCVFNGSSKTTNGNSLNDILCKGGVIQEDLFSIMLRFRKHAFAFSADIQKMFRQIIINPSQTHLQRILWKCRKDAPIQVYDLQTVTYGLAPSAYLATRVLQQLGADEKEKFPLAAAAIDDLYMDDILSGSSDLNECKNLQIEFVNLLACGGMTLHKWCSNHPQMQLGKSTIYSFDLEVEEKSVKTLGMEWYTASDTFSYKVSVQLKSNFTKRDVLSQIARIYDPLGLIGPVVCKAKIFMQRLWLMKLDWNTILPQSVAQEWIEFASSLPLLEKLKIPRFVLNVDIEKIIVHGFADASESAYGATIYIQSFTKDGSISSQLLCSKSRVSPIKTMTIPRLELSACLLLAQLIQKSLKALKMKVDKVLLWSDSTIALAWIKASPHQLKTFVGNRVSQIQTLSQMYQWRHVSSVNNPADIISRGLDAKMILDNQMWWYGPKFLSEEVETPDPMQDTMTDTLYLKELKNISLSAIQMNTILDSTLT